MLPHVQAQDGLHGLVSDTHEGVVLVGGAGDSQGAVTLYTQPGPARAKPVNSSSSRSRNLGLLHSTVCRGQRAIGRHFLKLLRGGIGVVAAKEASEESAFGVPGKAFTSPAKRRSIAGVKAAAGAAAREEIQLAFSRGSKQPYRGYTKQQRNRNLLLCSRCQRIYTSIQQLARSIMNSSKASCYTHGP